MDFVTRSPWKYIQISSFPVVHFFSIWIIYRSSQLDVSKKKDVLIDFTKFTVKPFRSSFILIKTDDVNFAKFLRTTF